MGNGWMQGGIAFHAYPQATVETTHGPTVAVYESFRLQTNGDGIRLFYATNLSVGDGWTLTGGGFHALTWS